MSTVSLLAVISGCGASHDSPSEVGADVSTSDGWKTIEHEGVRVQVPADWTRSVMDKCEWQSVRWAPSDVPVCGTAWGVSFYGSDLFDPAHGPGLRRERAATGARAWSGYVFAGDFAVYVVTDDRDLAQRVLRSAGAPED